MNFIYSPLPDVKGEKDSEHRLYVPLEVTGPSSYETGGFTVKIGLRKVEEAVVVLKNGDNLYKIGYDISGNEIKITVYTLGYDSTNSTLTISEVAAGTDLSGLKFAIFAIGY